MKFAFWGEHRYDLVDQDLYYILLTVLKWKKVRRFLMKIGWCTCGLVWRLAERPLWAKQPLGRSKGSDFVWKRTEYLETDKFKG